MMFSIPGSAYINLHQNGPLGQAGGLGWPDDSENVGNLKATWDAPIRNLVKKNYGESLPTGSFSGFMDHLVQSVTAISFPKDTLTVNKKVPRLAIVAFESSD